MRKINGKLRIYGVYAQYATCMLTLYFEFLDLAF